MLWVQTDPFILPPTPAAEGNWEKVEAPVKYAGDWNARAVPCEVGGSGTIPFAAAVFFAPTAIRFAPAAAVSFPTTAPSVHTQLQAFSLASKLPGANLPPPPPLSGHAASLQMDWKMGIQQIARVRWIGSWRYMRGKMART
jgi:hypothetical protein